MGETIEMFKLIFIITNLAYIFFLFTTVYSCPQKKTGGATAPSALPVPAPLKITIFIPISLSECLNQMRHRPCKVKPIWSHTMCLGTALICPSYEPICVGHCLLDQHFIFSPQCSKSSCFLASITPMFVSFVILLLSTAFTYGLCFLI